MLSFLWQFEKFGTGEGLLWYGICARCKKQASVVRKGYSVPETTSYGTGVHLHSEALGTGNALLVYRMGFRGASMGSVFVLGECLR